MPRLSASKPRWCFQSGFTSNAGVIPTTMEDGDAIITDELNHASIIDGVRLSKAARKIYKHNDMDALEDALKSTQDAKKRLIITRRRVFDGRRCRAADGYCGIGAAV